MTTPSPRPPDALRRAILGDLRPVTPIGRPWRRLLVLVPIAAFFAAVPMAALGLRHDAGTLGGLLWWLSGLQALAGVFLVGAALRESVPGRTLAGAAAALIGLALAWTVGVTLVTWAASDTVVPPGREALFFKICFRDTILLGLPTLGLALVLAARAFPLRPALVGGLAGMGAGLVSDAGWRTYCHVSDPRHVLAAHVLAVAALALIGALGGLLAGRRIPATDS